MAPVVIDLKNAQDPRDVVHQTVAALADGKLVAVPTETVYGIAASALSAEAVERLIDAKNRDGKPLALAVKSADDALDYAPSMPPLARRLARRCWPGPVTMVLRDANPESVVTRLPESVQQAVMPDGKIGLRVPAHETTLQTLRLSAGPMVLTSANLGGREPATSAEQVVEQLGDRVDLVIDDGPSKFGQASTVIEVVDSSIKILREGVVSSDALDQLRFFLAVVVCTGNTCRSPMGEAFLKQMVAEKLGCDVEDLTDRGISIRSAGIAAMPGGMPAAQSVDVLYDHGIDISNHTSQPMTDQLARHADLILTMTRNHRSAIVSQWPELAARTFVFTGNNDDISDPIGQSREVYAKCAEQIRSYAGQWVDLILKQAVPEYGP